MSSSASEALDLHTVNSWSPIQLPLRLLTRGLLRGYGWIPATCDGALGTDSGPQISRTEFFSLCIPFRTA
jgi:hypothetical protein